MLLILQHIYNEGLFHYLNKKEGGFRKRRKCPNFCVTTDPFAQLCLNRSLCYNQKGVFLVYYKYVWLIYSYILKRDLSALCMNGCGGYRKIKCFSNRNYKYDILQQAATSLNSHKNTLVPKGAIFSHEGRWLLFKDLMLTLCKTSL